MSHESKEHSTVEDVKQRLLDQAGQPNRVEGDQGEFEFGSLRDHVALMKFLIGGNVGIFKPGTRRKFMGSASSRFKPPGVDS